MNPASLRPSILPFNTEFALSRTACPPRVLIAYRMVALATLAALFWKWSFFRGCDAIYVSFPITDPFFPMWLQSVWTLRLAFIGTVSAITISAVTPSDVVRKYCAVLAFVGATVLVIHQGSHNDMTFATAWWTSLWSVWLAFRLKAVNQLSSQSRVLAQDDLLRRAAFLSRLILSMILLGGAIGKWTSEYWSGEVFYEIYFVERDFWVFNWLRGSFDDAALREIAMWYSRKVVVLETVAGFGLWLLPARYAAIVGVVIFASIALLSNFLLFSVLLSVIGLAAVGFFVDKRA